MLSFKRLVIAALTAAGAAMAQPALTTIQDTLYRADGTRFTGTVYITWSSFQAGDASNIATANLTIPIVNGTLRVRLVPTTTASAGAHYDVRYNSRGINDFTEKWAVPPSTAILRIRDVRVSAGAIIGPPPVVEPVQISDVIGLQNELALRLSKGVQFGLNRAAIINPSGQIDAAAGSLADCVRVDGSAGPCSNTGQFADAEAPTGVINGTNATFNLVHVPTPAKSLQLFRNGLQVTQNTDYSLFGTVITFFLGSVPITGDTLRASYRFGEAVDAGGTVTAPQVLCSSPGSTISLTASSTLGTCTIPPGTLNTGDRLEITFQYVHTGTVSGFNALVDAAGTTLFTRNGAGGDGLLTGKISYGIAAAMQTWSVQSWGNTLSVAFGAGSSTVDTSQTMILTFKGNLLTSSADTIGLTNFTVVRYPAQSNP